MVNYEVLMKDIFPNIGSDLNNINKDFVKYIDCPGQDGKDNYNYKF